MKKIKNIITKKDSKKIYNFFLKTNLEIALLKRDIDKLPHSVQKHLFFEKQKKMSNLIANIEMEYNMLSYISTNVNPGEKIDIDFSKYIISKIKSI